MSHRLRTADQACHIADEKRRRDQGSVVVDAVSNNFEDVSENTKFLKHSAHSDCKADDCDILHHTAHSTAVQDCFENCILDSGRVTVVSHADDALKRISLTEEGNESRYKRGKTECYNRIYLAQKQDDDHNCRKQSHCTEMKLSLKCLNVSPKISHLISACGLADSENREQHKADQKCRKRCPHHRAHMITELCTCNCRSKVCRVGQRT